jgi:hypothetical protein
VYIPKFSQVLEMATKENEAVAKGVSKFDDFRGGRNVSDACDHFIAEGRRRSTI